MPTILASLREVRSLNELYPRLDRLSISPGWAKPKPSLWPEPRENFRPVQWRWSDGRAALDAAGRLISTELAERRNLILYNPIEGNTYATVRTLIAAYQMILPGETARSHRHTPNALRFVLEGEGAYTIVDGQRLEMRPNDVLLTPNWCWHGHASEAAGPCAWIDILDVPLVHLLEPMFFEPHPEEHEPVTSAPTSSPLVFAWEDTLARLARAPRDPSGRHGRRIELGDPAMASTALYMERLEAGERTRRLRTTANQIACVAEGTGVTEIDGERWEWARGDVLALPGWRPFSHRATGDAVLFVATDEPVMRSFGWLRVKDED
jgi:gentisate 1,2-dioxygenase